MVGYMPFSASLYAHYATAGPPPTIATSIHFRPCLAFVLIMLKYVCMYIFPFSVRTYTFLVRFPCCCFWLVIKPFSSSFFNNGYRTP